MSKARRKQLTLTGSALTLATLDEFVYEDVRVALDAKARERMKQSVETVRHMVESGTICYGINTGFGAFANRQIPAEKVRQLQYNLVRSHCAGVGEPLSEELVRIIMLLKANSLAVGCSGIRPEVVDTLLALLNNDVLPLIPAKGSVGASGDLAPLAHLTMALIGEGEARHRGSVLNGQQVLAAAGCEPVMLEAKEGLAMLNGTQVSTALAVQGLMQACRLLDSAIVIGALTVEGLAGSHKPFDERIHEARGLSGQLAVAKHFRSLLHSSEINRSHEDCDRVQDPYAVRCMPQVFGAVQDTLTHAKSILEIECNSVSDNPLIFGEEVISGGNFHGAPIGFVSDFLSIAIADLASMSERRTDLLERRINPNLNMFLASEPGLESGFMIAHVSAAALCSENKTLAHPASVDSIPTSAGQEDHVSMSTWAGLKLQQICENTARVLAIELLASARAIDVQRPLKSTAELERLHRLVRGEVPFEAHDHRLDSAIETLAGLIHNGSVASFLKSTT